MDGGETSSQNYTNNSSCSICDFLKTIPISVVVLQSVTGFLVLFMNIVTCTALLKSRNLRTVLKYCLINLTIIDAVSGAVYIYHSVAVYVLADSYIECYIRYSIVSSLSALSLFTVLTMTFERLLALLLSFRYDSVFTKKNFGVYILGSWVFCLFISFMGMLSSEKDVKHCSWLDIASKTTNLLFGLTSLFTCLSIFCGNIVVFFIARRHIKAILPAMPNDAKISTGLKMNIKATMTTLSLVLPFLICNLPFSLFSIYLSTESNDENVVETIYILNATYSFGILNGIINPIVYSWRLPELRTALRYMCKNK